MAAKSFIAWLLRRCCGCCARCRRHRGDWLAMRRVKRKSVSVGRTNGGRSQTGSGNVRVRAVARMAWRALRFLCAASPAAPGVVAGWVDRLSTHIGTLSRAAAAKNKMRFIIAYGAPSYARRALRRAVSRCCRARAQRNCAPRLRVCSARLRASGGVAQTERQTHGAAAAKAKRGKARSTDIRSGSANSAVGGRDL